MIKPMKYSSIAALLAAGTLVACKSADESLPAGEETATVTEAVVETPPVKR